MVPYRRISVSVLFLTVWVCVFVCYHAEEILVVVYSVYTVLIHKPKILSLTVAGMAWHMHLGHMRALSRETKQAKKKRNNKRMHFFFLSTAIPPINTV